MSNLFVRSIFILDLLFCCLFSAQVSSKYIELEWKNGSEEAKKIMVSSSYYDTIQNWSPFSNDISNRIY
ncbi:hypothetical protein [Chryseobacterium sp.]|uniref:hypothetical protein n=1 Tax=Chryseobacterium sp. TaxID=1871047 RepID=UPI0031E402AC